MSNELNLNVSNRYINELLPLVYSGQYTLANAMYKLEKLIELGISFESAIKMLKQHTVEVTCGESV